MPEVVIEWVRYQKNHFQVADDTAAVTNPLINLMGHFNIGGRQVHDANIVATMQAYSISALTKGATNTQGQLTTTNIRGINNG
jgi:hypothetical protein